MDAKKIFFFLKEVEQHRVEERKRNDKDEEERQWEQRKEAGKK